MNLTKLDSVFSKYIRLKNSVNGYCTCISCGKIERWQDVDAGHFINRKFYALRYNEINVQPQCRACNRFAEGNIAEFGIALQKKYGEQIIKDLVSKKNNYIKWSQFDIDTLIKYYKNEVKLLEK